jgi:preprotein translocase subunit SecA
MVCFSCGGIHEEENRLLFASVNVAKKWRWPYRIQTSPEAKEGFEIQPEGRIYSSITIQHLIHLYLKISALTTSHSH